jgi:hypothetical protein
MFIVQTGDARRLRKFCLGMGAIYLVMGAMGALFTMHAYVRPRPEKKGFRVLGFRLL